MVEVFKTDIVSKSNAMKIIDELQLLLPAAKINFDLEDCDKILRIENYEIDTNLIENKLTELNCKFELLQ